MKNLLTLTAASLVALALFGSPAYADERGGHEGWQHAERHGDHDDWRWHRSYYRPVYYRAYAPAPVVYYQQPVAYYPQPYGSFFSLVIR